ncbi:hypothetical protein [Paenibacillus radicis (ex Gao et al. 2016)]|uniref:DUF4367 domain-containing protein n=1 Tax=Paenibacillus radicis (ex Gao et al. 2016) TaxID=1737354 RepID=A0A917M8B9_9BACL|nr:hypothetical protein [Paenibacillus radicis (ex Gao et al. 2016)]GGG81572.1 hypothetical protein GCM10010918_43580 [Paenibacillus radicis (ex Gao et al. 2016)]
MTMKDDKWTADEKRHKEEAWARLEAKLAGEEKSPLWAQWAEERSAAAEISSEQVQESVNDQVAALAAVHKNVESGSLAEAEIPSFAAKKPSGSSRWLKRHALKVGMSGAAAVIAIMIAIPTTNQALAALLNQFKMNEVVVVQENDLEQLAQIFYRDANLSTRFGDFVSSKTSEYNSDITDSQILQQFGVVVPELKLGEQTEITKGSNQNSVYTLKLNVEEINKTMKKLGAKKLLPESVDGKPLNLKIGRALNVYYKEVTGSKSGEGRSISLSYMDAPTIDIDPSIDAQEAFDAVVRLPVLPDYIRDAIVNTSRLEEGQIPFPIVSNGKMEQFTINDKTIYLEKFQRDQEKTTWSALWLADGKRVGAYFEGYEDRAAVIELITELTHQ